MITFCNGLSNNCYSPPLPYSICGFYIDCLEKYYPCGNEGYAISYGYKYCERFSDENFTNCSSDKGDEWMDYTLPCLQEALVPIIETNTNNLTCNKIKYYAFDSHSDCYTGGGGDVPNGPSICFLPLDDVKCILNTIDTKDLLSPLGIKEDIQTAQVCISQHEKSGLCDKVNEVVDETCSFWKDRLYALQSRKRQFD